MKSKTTFSVQEIGRKSGLQNREKLNNGDGYTTKAGYPA